MLITILLIRSIRSIPSETLVKESQASFGQDESTVLLVVLIGIKSLKYFLVLPPVFNAFHPQRQSIHRIDNNLVPRP